MRLVFDTNVIVAGIVAEGLCREIVEVELPQHEVFLSPPLWSELLGTLRDKFDLAEGELPILALYRRHATWLAPAPLAPPVCRDPDDDWVLATAIAAGAEAIVTGDRDLLDLGRTGAIEILTPREFLSRR